MIIVTGAAGLIGSAVIWALNRRGDEDILAVDCLGKDDRWKNLRALRFRDYMEKEDFLERLRSGSLPRGVRAIVHMGACSATTERDASYLIHNNFEYTKELALYATARDIRFVYASSAATYGDGDRGYADVEPDLDLLRPLNMYGYSKHLFDLWVRREGLSQKVAGLKYFNVYGPNEYHKGDMRSVVHKAFEQIQAGGPVRLFRSHRPDYGDGEQMRDFLYVKGAAAITLYMVDQTDLGGIYNVGSGKARTWNDLVLSIFAALGQEPRIEYIDMPAELRDRYQYFTEADLSKLHATGWVTPALALEDAVADYVRNYLVPGAFLEPADGPVSTRI